MLMHHLKHHGRESNSDKIYVFDKQSILKKEISEACPRVKTNYKNSGFPAGNKSGVNSVACGRLVGLKEFF